MHIIEIKANTNGAHRNQEYNGAIPPHWEGVAFIREDVSTLVNFPFGTPTVEEINGVMTVTAWEAGEIPEPEPEIPPEPTVDERVADLEAALAESDEVAMALYEANLEQETVNAEQDEAILGLYEMIGG